MGLPTKNKFKIRGRISGTVYARAETLRGAKVKRKKVARAQFIDESNLEIVGELGEVIWEKRCS
jgi:hypothetical protein